MIGLGRYQNKYAIGFALLFVAILGINGVESFDVLQKKKEAQAKSFATFDRYAKSYRALLPVKARWDALFSKASDIRDVESVYRLVDAQGAGLMASPDAMTIGAVKRITSDGKDIGLTALCPKSGNHKGFYVETGTTVAMLEGIRKLTDRIDILVNDISLISAPSGRISADLSLCVLVRDGK
jgi:hypothetical protein